MHFQLDPVGGLAGDMFAAALIGWQPALADELAEAFTTAGFSPYVSLHVWSHRDEILIGQRFEVIEHSPNKAVQHHAYREIQSFLLESKLAPAVLERALDIFELLAKAESRVHGVPIAEVSFHEVGAWDSIADVVAAAWLIERFAEATWFCNALPLGSGRIATIHGQLPVPAPATALLLEGFPTFQDGVRGERITPTGAAILRHLNPSFSPMSQPVRLAGMGVGFGTQRLEGVSNILRLLVFEDSEYSTHREQIAVCQFELDDQTPEDLAVALEHLRTLPGVLDIVQGTVVGKKGRVGMQVQLLVRPQALEAALDGCFRETTTLGVRWHLAQRAVLVREICHFEHQEGIVRVKRVIRPNGSRTSKAEMDALSAVPGGRASREQLRREAEQWAISSGTSNKKGTPDADGK